MLNTDIIKTSLQLDDYSYEVFISLIFREYYIDSFFPKSCICILVTPSSGDKGIDCIFKVIDTDDEIKFLLLQITKASKSSKALIKFTSPQSEEFYHNLDKDFIKSKKERFLISNNCSTAKNVDCIISGKQLDTLITLYITKFQLVNDEGFFNKDFSNCISFITKQWEKANNLRNSNLSHEEFYAHENYDSFYIIQRICNIRLKDIDHCSLLIKYGESLRKNSYERGCRSKSKKPTYLDYKVESGLDQIFELNPSLKTTDLLALKYLLKTLYKIVDKVNSHKLNNYFLAIDFTKNYLCIKKVSKQYESDFQVIGYFNYCFGRLQDSYLFNFLNATDTLCNQLNTEYGLNIINNPIKKIPDNRNFRGKTYWILPNIKHSKFKYALEKLIIEANKMSPIPNYK